MFKVVSTERVLQRTQWLATVTVFLLPLAVFWLGPHVMSRGLVPVPWDKLLHLSTYALLAMALGLASRLRGAGALWLAFVGAVLMGALDEYLQIARPGRSADWADLTANITGAALGCGVLWMMAKGRDR